LGGGLKVEVVEEGKKISNIVAGHKAALHNPNVSAEAKEHSRKVLQELEK